VTHPDVEPDLVIRRATPEDVPALVEVATDAFRETYRLIDDPDDIEDYVATQFTPAVLASHLEDASSTVLIAHLAQQCVGYAHVIASPPPASVTGPSPVEIARLYRRAQTIGKGYGASLMRAVHDEARRRHCQTLWLGVYERNERARATSVGVLSTSGSRSSPSAGAPTSIRSWRAASHASLDP